jgi:hypothetical protein
VLHVNEVEPDAPPVTPWREHLAMWATRRAEEGYGDLAGSVVTLTAPELNGDELIGVGELAVTGGVAASTVRAYLARGEGDLPAAQATVNGRSMWARPVAEEWAEQRRRSTDAVKQTVSSSRKGAAEAPSGIAELWGRYTQVFFSYLWAHPDNRKRWALRWRNEAAVRHIAEDLSWSVAGDLSSSNEGIIQIGDLAVTIRDAMLYDLARSLRFARDEPMPVELEITPALAQMLDWLIRHRPTAAGQTIGEIIGEAEREHEIPREVCTRTLRSALHLDGKTDPTQLDEFLDRVMPPSSTR